MAPGNLNARLAIYQPSATQDALGQPTTGWTLLKSVWGDIRYATGLENVMADAQRSTVRASIRIRKTTGLHSGMRVIHDSVTFHILAVLPGSSTSHHIDLVCEVIT
jgi:SPP1 family predicted phage head-tail adaptor